MTNLWIFLTFIIMCFTFFKELQKKSLSVFLWIGLIIFFGIAHLFQIRSTIFSEDILDGANYFVCIFCTIYLFTRFILSFLFKSKSLQISSVDFSELKIQKFTNLLYNVLIIATLAYCALVILYAGNVSNISKRLIYEFRANNIKVIILNFLWQATVPVTLFYLMGKQKKRFLVCMCCIIIKSFISLTRTYLLEVFVAIAIYILYKKQKVNFRKIILGSLTGTIAIYLMHLLRGFRYYYNFSDIGTISWFDLHQKAFGFIEMQSGDIFLNTFFYRLIQYGNWIEGIVPGASYLRLLMLPIPSSLSFGLKPQDICVTIGYFFGGSGSTNAVSYTVTPTLFGDVYVNFLWVGCLLGGIIWALIVSVLDFFVSRKKTYSQILISMLIASAYVNIARGSVYNPFFNIFYGVIIQLIIYKISMVIPSVKFKINKEIDK